MKRIRKLTALLLAATLLLTTVEPAVSAKAPSQQETAAGLQEPAPREEVSWEEQYPYGGFALGLSELVLQEDGAARRLTVRRLGGTTGKASAVISYQPAVTETETGVDYSSAISADDIAIQAEDPLPITRYQPWGMPPAPEAAQVRVISREGTDGQGEPCTILSLDGEGEEYQWYALRDGVWDEIQDGTGAELPVAEEDLALYDFRCVFRQGETRCCTDSYGGEPYEKPEEEEPEPAPEGLDLNPEPTYSQLDLTQGDTPCDGLLFELCFAEGESEKDLLFTAKEDSLPELREFAALTIVDSVGGDVVDSMNTLLLAIEDDDQELDEPSQIGFTVSQAEFDQADGAASLTVRRTGGVTAALTVDWALEPGTAQPGVDYADASGQLTFYGPQTEQTIRLELVDDQRERLEEKTLTVRLSNLLGDSRATLVQDSCAVSLFNSGAGEGRNLASVLSGTEAQDVSSQVRESEGAPVSSGEVTGEQVTEERIGESSVEWDQTGARSWNSYNGNGTISFSGGNWSSTVSYPQSLDSTGGDSTTVRIPNLGALYQSLSGTVSGGAKFASGWNRFWHGDEEYAYTAFEMFQGSSSSYWDCEPHFSRPSIFKIKLSAYNTFTVRQSWSYQQDDGTLSLEVRKHDSCGSADTIHARSKVSLRRRPFSQPFRLEICTANDQDNTTPGVPRYTEQNYKNLIKSVSITDGGSTRGTLYEGSSFDITLGDTNLVCTSADLVNSKGARQMSGSVADRRISFHNVVLPPHEEYTVRLTLARRQTLSIDLNGSMETDAGGVPVSGAADRALALLRSRSGGAKIGCGVSCSQSRTNLPTSQKNGIASLGLITDAQCVNFSLPKEDIIVFNGKTYAGDATIWLEPKDLALQNLTFYYYEKDFIAAQRPMRASIDVTALYYDGNANGMIDGYWDADASVFVLDPDSKDVFVDRLSDGDYEETTFSPVVDETGFHQYFLRAYYSANPVCLTVPSGHSASERMQVMPGFITNVTDPAAYLSLTNEQKQYRTVVSGKTKLSQKASPSYSADNHPKYTAAASAYSYVDIPLGGDASPSRAMTSKDLGVSQTDGRYGEDYILNEKVGDGSEGNKKLKNNEIKTKAVKYDLSVRLGIILKYNALSGAYEFSEAAASITGSVSLRLQYRFTCLPVLCVYAQFGAKATVATGLTVKKDAVLEDILPKGESVALNSSHPQYWYTARTKGFSAKFSGRLYLEIRKFTDLDGDGEYGPGDMLGDPLEGTHSGYLESNGGKAVEKIFHTQRGFSLKEPVVVIFSARNGDSATIQELSAIADSSSQVYWSGMKLSVQGSIELGLGVDVVIASAELYARGNIGFTLLPSSRQTGGSELLLDSFSLGAALGFRVVFLCFKYQMDLVEYHLRYKNGTGWSHGWSALGGRYNGDTPLRQREDGVIDVTITLPDRLQTSVLDNGVTGKDAGIEPTAFDTDAQDFQVSGYGASVNAYKLVENTATGYDYRIVTVGKKNYVVYTGTDSGAASPVDQTELWLSELDMTKSAQGKEAYGLVNPIQGQAAAAEQNHIPVEGDGTGDLDFTAWAQGDLIHVVWVSYASPSAVSDADAATGDMVAAASRNTVVKHAVFDTKDTDPNAGFSTPGLLSDPGSGAYCFLPASSGDAAVYAQSVPYTEQEASQRLAEYESYLDDTAQTDGDGTQATQDYLEASKEFRLSSQSAMLSLYGGNSRLTVVGPEGEALANGVMYVSRHQENGDGQAQDQTDEILTDLAAVQAGDSHYLAYATQQDLFQKEDGRYTDLRSIYRLYLRSFSLEENTGAAPGKPAQKVKWGEPYLLRTLVNGEQDSSADGVYDASLHRQAGYKDPYFANLSFLTGRLGDKLSGEPEEFRPFAEMSPETFLLFEMNGSTYVIDEKSLTSITQGDHTGTIHPFFTYRQRYGQALEQGSEENLSSGKSQVVIGSDGDGNVAAVYTGSVSGTVNNAIYIAYWDPESGAWSDGVMLAMNHMDVYERSVSNHWDGAATEAAYLDEKQGGGMTSLTFTNLQIALGRGSASSPDGSGQGPSSQTDIQDSGESLYGDLVDLPAPGDGGPSDDILFAAAEKADLSAEEKASSPTSELLILTQGSLQNLQKTEILDDGKQVTGSVVTPEKDESGSAKSPVVNVYAISYGKGSQQVGAASIQFAETLFTAGSALDASVNFKNVGDAAIRGSGDQPILTELRLHDGDGSSDALLASWHIPQNISPGQAVSLETADRPCAPLPADLGAGDYFYLTVSEDEDYVSQPYRYRSDSDLNISYRYDVEDKPELSLENLSAQAVGVTQDGRARVELSFDAANRGKTGAEEVFVQLSYLSGYDSEEQPIYSPLDLTGSELRVSQQRHVPASRAVTGRNDLENGVLYLGTDDSFYTAAYYITQDEYQKILSSYYNTTAVEGWSQGAWNGQTYWFDGARFGSAYAAYQAGQEAVSGWTDGGNGYYYNNKYSSFSQAKAAADADRRMDYIRTAAQMEPLPQEEKGNWAKDSGSGEYYLKSLGSYRDALAAYQEALRDNTQNIKPDYLRTVRGTVPVDPQKFLGKATGSLELRAELFSLSSDAQPENGLYSSDHLDEYCQSNNSALASVEHETFFSSVPRLVLSQNSVRQIPVSASTTRGRRPSIRVMEVEDGHKELSTLAFRPTGGSATVSGKLSILGAELGSGVIHLLDENTNTTYPIAYTVAGAGDGVNIFCDDDQFAFYNADGKAWSPDLSNQDWEFQAVPSWTDQKLEPCLDNLSQGQKGAYFTFQSQAESFSFTLVGSATVTSNRFPQSFSIAGTMADPASAVIDFGNQEGVTHTITVKITSDRAWFDVIKPTYGEDYLPNDDPNAPGLYWSRSFPGANSVQAGEPVELTVYAVDAGGLQALSWNGQALAPGDPGFQAHNGGMWSYTFPVTENGSLTVTAIDDQGLATTRQITVDWFHDGLTTGCGRAPSLFAGLVKSERGVETPFTGGTLGAEHAASGDVFLKIDAQGEGALSYSSFHTGIGDFDTPDSLNRITGNGWYMVKLSGPESWSAKLFAVDCFETAPSVQVIQTPSRLPNSVTLSWTASKDRESTEKLSGVTLNGQDLLGGDAVDSTSFSGEVTVRSGGVYTFLATDSGNVTGRKPVKVTVPVDLSDPGIFTQTDDWGQPGGPGHGSVTIDFSKVSGGDYVNYTGSPLPLEDYRGSYQYAVAEEADYSAFFQDKDWLNGLTWTDAAHDDVLTAEGLPAGRNGAGYVVLVRDAQNPQDYSAMTVQHILMRSAAIEAPSLTAQNASGQDNRDGRVAVEAAGGVSGEYQFAILPQEEGAELTAQDFQAPGVAWRLSRDQEGDSAVFDGLKPGTYRVAVRALYAQGSALDQARQELFQAQRAYRAALRSVESNALDRTEQVNAAHSDWQAAPEEDPEDVQEKEAAYQAALEDLGDQAQELLRLDREWLALEEGPERTALRKAYQTALFRAWRDWYEDAQSGELSAASTVLAAAETAYQAQAALASSQSAGEYGSSAAPAWDGMLLTQAVEVGVGSAPAPEIHTGSAAAGAKNGSLLASAGMGGGTLHYQFALLPLQRGEEPVDYSGDPAAISGLDLAWRFADDPSAQPEQALFDGLPAGEYQVFLRPVYDPDPEDDYDVNDRLHDGANALPWGIDDLTALRNAYLDAWNALGEDPSPQLQAALSLVEDTYLLALGRLEEQASQAYRDDPGRYASASWATAKVEAHPVPSSSEEEEEPEVPDFEDIQGHWAKDSILFAARRGLFQGVSKTRFDPEGGMTRAMLVTVLHRLARLPDGGKATSPFEDVPEGAWYEEAVRWAYSRGVVMGVSETRFAPEQKVTREQAVAMLWRYLRTSGLGGGEQAGLEAYPDAGKITDYAQEAFSWAVAVGVVQGTSSGLLDPGLGITRAQAAAILERTVRLLGE